MISEAHRGFVKLERHEAKYLVHPDQVPGIRDFIRPFTVPDPHARPELPEYCITTLQLDSPDLILYRMREIESLNRFKLRVRCYGYATPSVYYLEIKRKIKSVVVKSRASVPAEYYSPEAILHPRREIPFRSEAEEWNYLEFVRLTQQIGARPVVIIRYLRESYMGRFDRYSRVTLDRCLQYRPARGWEVCPQAGRWWAMDSSMALNRPFSGLILEMKTYSDVPQWMVDMVERFNLTRVGFCKYAVAVRLESLFCGGAFSDASETVGFL